MVGMTGLLGSPKGTWTFLSSLSVSSFSAISFLRFVGEELPMVGMTLLGGRPKGTWTFISSFVDKDSFAEGDGPVIYVSGLTKFAKVVFVFFFRGMIISGEIFSSRIPFEKE
jgi:hypothetical protein